MENILLYNTFLYRATCAFMLVPSFTLYAMELQETTPHMIAVDLEARSHNATALTIELVRHIQTGNVAHIRQLLTEHTTSESTLVSALQYTQEKLAIEQEHIAQRTFGKFFTQYKRAIIPAMITAYSVVNLTLSVLSYCQLQQPPSNIDIASLSLNVAGSVLPGIVYSGYQTIKHIRSGWLDSYQKCKIAQLENSQTLLQLLHETRTK